MIKNYDTTNTKKKAYNKNVFIIPVIICVIGFVICFVSSLVSEDIGRVAFVGYFLLSVGTMLGLSALVEEKYRLGLDIRFPLKIIFPAYPFIPDYDDLTRSMSSFKSAYSEFMNATGNKNNSKLQEYATQLLWHCLYLQKNRMEKFGLQSNLEFNRRSHSKGSNGVRCNTYFDGRYDVKDVSEEIYASRSFIYRGKVIRKVLNKQVLHYTFLSAKNVSNDELLCPCCGNVASRSNLIDGCDFCRTKFTVEDLDNRISNYCFRRDFIASEGKRKAIKKLIYPWIYMLGMLPMMYMGFFLPFLYVRDMNFFVQFGSGLLCAVALGFGGFSLCLFSMFFIVPIVSFANLFFGVLNDKLIYRSKEEQEKELKMANEVRNRDPLFSIQSFFSSVQNKIYAIHFADTNAQINAFSDCDISNHLQKYTECIFVNDVRHFLERN